MKWYGEAEFWLSTGKVILILIVFLFTFITMVGGNPKHDAYGFRYWKDPGSFAEHITTGSLGRFEGFLGAVWSASFTVVGPEYISMVAGETKLPRRYLKTAFKTTYARFAFFFIGSALCVGIVIPSNDKTLLDILSGSSAGSGTAAASPYVIAMNNLGISVLPHITNALLVTSIFSAGNAYTYYWTRSLYGLSLQGQAPKILRKCTKKGVPIYCLFIVIHFPVSRFPQCVKWFGEGFNVVDEHYHCRSGNRLHNYLHYLHLLLPRFKDTRIRSPHAPLLWILPAILSMDWTRLDDDGGMHIRIRGLFARKLDRW